MATLAISPIASLIGLPVSSHNNFAKLSLSLSTKETNFIKRLALSCKGTLAHSFCASKAASTALSQSSFVLFGTVSISALVAGLVISITSPLLASHQLATIKFFAIFYSFPNPVNDRDKPPTILLECSHLPYSPKVNTIKNSFLGIAFLIAG